LGGLKLDPSATSAERCHCDLLAKKKRKPKKKNLKRKGICILREVFLFLKGKKLL